MKIAGSGRKSDAQPAIAVAEGDRSVAMRPPIQATGIAIPPSRRDSPGPASEPANDDTLTPTEPVVRDNLGNPVPIAAAELDAVETYLDEVLRDLLAPAMARKGER